MRKLFGRIAAAKKKFAHVAGTRKTVGQRAGVADGKRTRGAGAVQEGLRLAAMHRKFFEVNAAADLHGEIDCVTRRRPHWRALAIINHRGEFVAVAAIGIHQPDVRVFHSGLTVGEAALGREKRDLLAVRRPQRMILRTFDGRELMNGAIRWIDFVNVVMKKLISVWRAIRAEKNFRAAW